VIIIGIDPSTTSLGYAVYDHAAGRLVDSGTLRCAGKDAFSRTERLRVALHNALRAHSGAQFVMLERMFSTKGSADRALANIVYAVKQIAADLGMRVREISVGTWRKRLVGKGDASKQQVQAYVQLVHGRKFPSLDESEAIGIAMAATREDFQ
jgi:Holliday junction resolvasome RuvABC endonuclease subunit